MREFKFNYKGLNFIIDLKEKVEVSKDFTFHELRISGLNNNVYKKDLCTDETIKQGVEKYVALAKQSVDKNRSSTDLILDELGFEL